MSCSISISMLASLGNARYQKFKVEVEEAAEGVYKAQ